MRWLLGFIVTLAACGSTRKTTEDVTTREVETWAVAALPAETSCYDEVEIVTRNGSLRFTYATVAVQPPNLVVAPAASDVVPIALADVVRVIGTRITEQRRQYGDE